MDIKLTGALPRGLKDMGLKPGDKFFDVEAAPGRKYGAVQIKVFCADEEREQVAVVYQENYKKI